MKKFALLLPVLAAFAITGCGASDAECNEFAAHMVEMLQKDLGEKKAAKFVKRQEEYFDVCKETANPREIACARNAKDLHDFLVNCNY